MGRANEKKKRRALEQQHGAISGPQLVPGPEHPGPVDEIETAGTASTVLEFPITPQLRDLLANANAEVDAATARFQAVLQTAVAALGVTEAVRPLGWTAEPPTLRLERV